MNGGKVSFGIDDDGALKAVDQFGNVTPAKRKRPVAPVQRAE